MGSETAGPMTLKVRLDQAARTRREHILLGRDGFRSLIRLLRAYPDVGVPLLSHRARLRICLFNGFEVMTHRTSSDELVIISIRSPSTD